MEIAAPLHSFWANQFRRAYTAAAYVRVAGAAIASGAHGLRRAQVSTLRERF